MSEMSNLVNPLLILSNFPARDGSSVIDDSKSRAIVTRAVFVAKLDCAKAAEEGLLWSSYPETHEVVTRSILLGSGRSSGLSIDRPGLESRLNQKTCNVKKLSYFASSNVVCVSALELLPIHRSKVPGSRTRRRAAELQ